MTSSFLRPALREFSAVDRATYAAIARAKTPQLDRSMRTVSIAADHSKLWFAFSAGLAVSGGPKGRRAALGGAAAIGVASATVNLVFKRVGRRRPDRAGAGVPELRHVPMPHSLSFPSGHSASAFAFATTVGHMVPLSAPGLRLAAALVAYSRVHTGVHYPGDVIAGSLIGAVAGSLVAGAADHRLRDS